MIEMLVVFIVFGVSAMIAIRSVGDTLRRDRVAKAAAILSSDLEQAFALAARQRTPIRIILDTFPTRLRVLVIDRGDTTAKYRTRGLKNGEFTLDFMSTSRDSLDVMPNGLATDTLNLTLGITSASGSQYTKTIRVTRGGLVRVNNR
jgi:type II secretory pathway pseudopilin PulG